MNIRRIAELQERKAQGWEQKHQREVQRLAKELRDLLRSAPQGAGLTDWTHSHLSDIVNLAKDWGI